MTTLSSIILSVCRNVEHYSLLEKGKLRPLLYATTHLIGQLESIMTVPSAGKVTEQSDIHTLLVGT